MEGVVGHLHSGNTKQYDIVEQKPAIGQTFYEENLDLPTYVCDDRFSFDLSGFYCNCTMCPCSLLARLCLFSYVHCEDLHGQQLATVADNQPQEFPKILSQNLSHKLQGKHSTRKSRTKTELEVAWNQQCNHATQCIFFWNPHLGAQRPTSQPDDSSPRWTDSQIMVSSA